jgi:hypothetical protein
MKWFGLGGVLGAAMNGLASNGADKSVSTPTSPLVPIRLIWKGGLMQESRKRT